MKIRHVPPATIKWKFIQTKTVPKDLNGDVVRSISHGLSHHINNVIQDAVFVMERFFGKVEGFGGGSNLTMFQVSF